MLYSLLDYLNTESGGIPGFGVFKYLSFRAALAMAFALIISMLIGKRIIKILLNIKIRETIRVLGPDHGHKAGTPTMGGLIILAAIIIPTLLWADLGNAYVLLILGATIWMAAIGFIDDYIKVFRQNKSGLKGKFKIVGQVGLGTIVGCVMVFHPDFQGPKGRLNDDNLIITNDFLLQNGFEKGDILLDPVTFDYTKGTVQNPPSIYTVARLQNNPKFNDYQEIKFNVPAGKELSVAAALFGHRYPGFETSTNVPFIKDTVFSYSSVAFWEDGDEGIWGKIVYILMAIFIVTAVSNGVNITDGLDGLAAGTSAIAASTLAIFAYVSGNLIFSQYLNISYIPLSSELFIYSAAFIGACVGFLWYNTHPAQVFMGDTGSLMLGGAIGVLALMVKKELLLPLIAGIFLIESLSVIIQVTYFKYTKRKTGEGKRIFRMAPLHHHFEKLGIAEEKIVSRFWIAAILLAVLTFVTLKLR